jgi:hypothetical protein
MNYYIFILIFNCRKMKLSGPIEYLRDIHATFKLFNRLYACLEIISINKSPYEWLL